MKTNYLSVLLEKIIEKTGGKSTTWEKTGDNRFRLCLSSGSIIIDFAYDPQYPDGFYGLSIFNDKVKLIEYSTTNGTEINSLEKRLYTAASDAYYEKVENNYKDMIEELDKR